LLEEMRDLSRAFPSLFCRRALDLCQKHRFRLGRDLEKSPARASNLEERSVEQLARDGPTLSRADRGLHRGLERAECTEDAAGGRHGAGEGELDSHEDRERAL